MSKIQELVDNTRALNQANATQSAIEELVKAVELLAKGVAQVMGDLDRAQSSRTDIPIK